MSLACLAGLQAIETGRWRWLVLTAVLLGLAFNTKTLAACIVAPGARRWRGSSARPARWAAGSGC